MLSTFSIWHAAPFRHTPRRRGTQYAVPSRCYSPSRSTGSSAFADDDSCRKEPSAYASPSQIHFDHALVRRDLIDGPLRQHRAFVQAGHLDAEFADEGHVVLDDHDGLFLVDLLEQFRGLVGLDVGH